MVVTLGPGKFYGTSLPRPRIYTDAKFNDERVDPPVPVSDPLMAWANEAHWSMGGLSFKRLRLMGKIEGNVDKLRVERENLFQKQNQSVAGMASSDLRRSKGKNVNGSENPSSSPPPAPIATKRRRFMAFLDDIDEDEEDEEKEESSKEEEVRVEAKNSEVRRRLVKKLAGDFDRVASEKTNASDTTKQSKKGSPLKGSSDKSDSMALGTRSRRSEKSDGFDISKVIEDVNISNTKSQVEISTASANGVRTSQRLAKRGSS